MKTPHRPEKSAGRPAAGKSSTWIASGSVRRSTTVRRFIMKKERVGTSITSLRIHGSTGKAPARIGKSTQRRSGWAKYSRPLMVRRSAGGRFWPGGSTFSTQKPSSLPSFSTSAPTTWMRV